MGNVSDFVQSNENATFKSPDNVVSFQKSGTFTVPAGVTQIWLSLVGGGAARGAAETESQSAVLNVLYDTTYLYGAVFLFNSQARVWPRGGDGGSGKTFNLTTPNIGNPGTNGRRHYLGNMYYGPAKTKVFSNGQILTTATTSLQPFAHFDLEKMDIVQGPNSARGTGHFSGLSAVTGKRWAYDETTGTYYYWGTDRWLSYTTDVSNTGTLTTVDLDSGVIGTNSSIAAFIEIQNSIGIAFNATPFANNAERENVIRYTTDGGATWATPDLSALPSVGFSGNFIGFDTTPDYSKWFIYWRETSNSGTDRIIMSDDGGATWTEVCFAPVQTSTAHAVTGVQHGRFVAVNPDGSRIAMIGNFEANAFTVSGDVLLVFDNNGNLINGHNTATKGNLDAVLRSNCGEYIIGSQNGIPTCHRFDDGSFVGTMSSNMAFYIDSSSAVRACITPCGNVMGGGHPTTTGSPYISATTPTSCNGGDTVVSGSFGSVTAKGGEQDTVPDTSGQNAGNRQAGSTFPIGPFSESASQDVRNSGLAALRFSGTTGANTADPSAPGGHIVSTEFQRVNGEGGYWSTGPAGGGGETLVRQPVTVTPGETLTVSVPIPPLYCLPGVAVLEYNNA